MHPIGTYLHTTQCSPSVCRLYFGNAITLEDFSYLRGGIAVVATLGRLGDRSVDALSGYAEDASAHPQVYPLVASYGKGKEGKGNRSISRAPRRCNDDLVKVARTRWMRMSQGKSASLMGRPSFGRYD